MPSHNQFHYYFDDTEGITFGEYIPNLGDLLIYYNSLMDEDYIDCNCSRWDVNDYSIIVETVLDKNKIQTLNDNIVPGAVGELYSILGKPNYYDKTWDDKNTLKLVPNVNNDSTLKSMREEKIIYVKNIMYHPIGDTNHVNVKIEGLVSGSRL